MGSTITVGKHVAAFRAPDEVIYYALFEKTYESNCYPHTPHWSCGHFGTLETALTRIFDYASSCEGGMLRGPSGAMTPENYIAHWLRLMKAPHVLPDRGIILTTGGSYRHAFSPKTCAEGAAVFSKPGLAGHADDIAAGIAVTVPLYECAFEIARLCASLVTPWKILAAPCWMDDEERPDLGYNPRPAKTFTMPRFEIYKIGEHEHIMRDADGRWRVAGWAYSLVADYVKSLRANDPAGVYRKQIPAYREAIGRAQQIPPGATITIAPRGPWNWRSSEGFKAKMEAGDVFTVPAAEAIENCVDYIPREWVTWNLPVAEAVAA